MVFRRRVLVVASRASDASDASEIDVDDARIVVGRSAARSFVEDARVMTDARSAPRSVVAPQSSARWRRPRARPRDVERHRGGDDWR
jgi:hypothetical protein